jgi:hypothetical protein
LVERRENKIQEEFHGARLRVYGTNQVDPEEGRIFVWTKTGWFERIAGSQGNVAFTPIADSESELSALVAQDNPSLDFIELGGEIRKLVSEEFREQSTNYQDTPVSSEDEFVNEEEEQQEQEYHQHDL